MLTVRPKISELAFRVFGRPLHPELFEIYATRTITRDKYRLKVDITSAGHLLTFQRHGQVVSEVAASNHQPLPSGMLLSDDVIGDPTDRQLILPNELCYTYNFELESAEPKTFVMIQHHLQKSAPCEGMFFQFESSGRISLGAISYINIQSRCNRVHIRAFHTFPDAYVVMKSESIFLIDEPAK